MRIAALLACRTHPDGHSGVGHSRMVPATAAMPAVEIWALSKLRLSRMTGSSGAAANVAATGGQNESDSRSASSEHDCLVTFEKPNTAGAEGGMAAKDHY